jgi:predicted nucleotidyltransferase
MATALELKRVGWQSYVNIAGHRSNRPEVTALESATRLEVLKRVRKAVRQLNDTFPVRRVLLFGSLAHQGWFAPDSDVDLAVEGLRPRDYWKAWQLLDEAVGIRRVDLVDLETASESLRQAIERYGIEL